MNDLILYGFVAFVTCLSPGPGVLCTLSSALRNGRAYALVAPAGNAIGVLLMSILSATGLGALITASPTIYCIVQALGGLVLFYLGLKNWQAPVVDLAGAADFENKRNSKDTRSILSASILLQTTNPMAIVFLLSLLPQFIRLEDDYVTRVSLLIAIFVLVCLLVHLAYSYAAIYARRYLKGERFSRILNKTSALLFWLMASSVLVTLTKSLLLELGKR